FKKPHVIFAEKPYIVNAIFQHSGSFYTHAKGETGIFFGIDAAVLQYIGVYHATAQYFYPAGFFANIATFSAANKTAYVHFGAGFGEREIRRAETYLHILAIHFFHKEIKGLFQIG